MLELDGFKVIGEAEDGRSALAAARALQPDLVLLDVRLPDTTGFEVAEELAQDDNPPIVVLTSSRDDSEYGSQVESSPATGFLPKHQLSGGTVAALIARTA